MNELSSENTLTVPRVGKSLNGYTKFIFLVSKLWFWTALSLSTFFYHGLRPGPDPHSMSVPYSLPRS